MTLNQVLISIENYFKEHPMIKSVITTTGDDALNAEPNLTYPLVNLQFVDTDVLDKRFQHNLKIIICDLTNPNVDQIDFEIYSDTIQIAGDFFHWLENNYEFDYIKTTSLQPFNDSNIDRTSGIVFNIGLFTWINKNIDC